MDWFSVDKEGLAKLLEKRGKAFAILELLQNCWDADGVSFVDVYLRPIPNAPRVQIAVNDDAPEGFKDLAHAFTLFAESEKKDKPEKRGRFNLGEKLVLAICDEARIESTTGTVIFDRDGRRRSGKKTARGSSFSGVLRMKREEYDEALRVIRTLLPPPGVKTIVNGEVLAKRTAIHSFEATLPTEIADAEGNLRRTSRKTTIRVYEPLTGETPSLYEMGIPIVETSDRYHYEIGQKCPLNMDRDNVPPSFLRQLRTLVVNEMHEKLTEKDANATWVREATSDEDCAPEAVKKVMNLRFGEKRVAYDPSDPEANKRAVAEGYTVVTGSMMNATEWANAKKAEAIRPAGQVTPSPKPYGEDGRELDLLDRKDWTPGMWKMASFASDLAKGLLGCSIEVVIAREVTWPYGATYGSGRLVFNMGRLGRAWFDRRPFSEGVIRLLLHEFSHHFGGGDHLDEKYHSEICALGARLAVLVLERPDIFRKHFDA